MSAPIPVVVLGASGRMGRTVLGCLPEFPALALVDSLADARVAVDFTLPEAVRETAAACRAAGVALVCGVTGIDPQGHAALRDAAGEVPVLWAPNLSAGIAVLERLATLAAGSLREFDAGVYEVHHAAKRDAPSGTALALGRAVAAGRGLPAPAAAPDAALRAQGLGYAVLRIGDVVGEHTVALAGPGERIELTHRATDRAIFARGALRAAGWLAGRAPGMYTFAEVLGLGRVDTPADGQ
jgi:4-hydroxy-tetrahydrodipicolinate reductase